MVGRHNLSKSWDAQGLTYNWEAKKTSLVFVKCFVNGSQKLIWFGVDFCWFFSWFYCCFCVMFFLVSFLPISEKIQVRLYFLLEWFETHFCLIFACFLLVFFTHFCLIFACFCLYFFINFCLFFACFFSKTNSSSNTIQTCRLWVPGSFQEIDWK